MAADSMQTLNALGFARVLARRSDAHKGDAGRALLIGGAPSMAGALLLAGQGALYGGAGYSLLMMMDPSSAHVLQSQPELMVHDAALWEPAQAIDNLRPDVLAIGPGLGRSAQALHWLRAALVWQGPLVIDADAINLLVDNPPLLDALRERQQATTLTPHPGEAGRLLAWDAAQVQADRPEAIKRLVAHTRSIVVLKGRHTLIGAPDHPVEQCQDGNPGMAVAGMGDVLTGCIAALAAQGVRAGLDLWQATCLAVQVHAIAADELVGAGVGPIGLTPGEVAVRIRHVVNRAAAGNYLA
jgi:hydroxyethylthiazole kinase-like uncharacterized protein yjeF